MSEIKQASNIHARIKGLWLLGAIKTSFGSGRLQIWKGPTFGSLIYAPNFQLFSLVSLHNMNHELRLQSIYSGTFEILDEEFLSHNIQYCNESNRIGQKQRRSYQLTSSDKMLILEGETIVGGNQGIIRAEWVRNVGSDNLNYLG